VLVRPPIHGRWRDVCRCYGWLILGVELLLLWAVKDAHEKIAAHLASEERREGSARQVLTHKNSLVALKLKRESLSERRAVAGAESESRICVEGGIGWEGLTRSSLDHREPVPLSAGVVICFVIASLVW
jgi:hypothetical protein